MRLIRAVNRQNAIIQFEYIDLALQYESLINYPINKKWPCMNVLRPVTGMAKILDRNEIVTDLILLGRIIIFLD